MVATGSQTIGPRSVASESEPSGVMRKSLFGLITLVRGFAHNVSYVKLI